MCLVFVVGRIDTLMEGLKAKLETAYKASGGRKVNIISHSMGGILTLCFMCLHNDVRLRHLCYFYSILYRVREKVKGSMCLEKHD